MSRGDVHGGPPSVRVNPASVRVDPARVRVKICGVCSAEIAMVAAEAGADAVGFVLAPGSPRTIDASRAQAIAATLPPWVAHVAVFVDMAGSAIATAWPRGWVQLHGREQTVADELAGRAVIKAVSIADGTDELLRWDDDPRARALLVDGPSAGGGEPFDLGPLMRVRDRLRKPLILAGGLTPANVGNAIRAVRPWAVDVSSGVESSRGVKDPKAIREFCWVVREAAT